MTLRASIRSARAELTYGLTRKVSLCVALLLTAFTATLTSVNIIAEQGAIQERLDLHARSVAAMLADFASNYLTDLRIDELRIIVQDIQRREDVLYAYVLDSDDTLIAHGDVGDDGLFEVVDDPISRRVRALGKGFLVLDEGGLHAVEPVILDYEKLGTVRLGMSTEQMHRDIIAVRNRNLLLGLAFLAVSLAFSLPLVRRITRPLKQLTESTEAASLGRFEQRILIDTNDEIETLAESFNRMLTELQQRTEQIRTLAFFDSITKLPNRIYFKEMLARAIASAKRHDRRGAVLYLDLDRFKLINDGFGHDAGDRLLQGFAHRLTNCVRASDVVAREQGEETVTFARLGGDEFTILLSEISATGEAAQIAERILKMLEQPFDLGAQSVVVGTSIGIAIFPDDGFDPDSVLKNADTAMYHAKEKGRNNVQFYSRSLGAQNLQRVTLERELRYAIEHGEFVLHYQPQIDLQTSEVVGVEALLRWRHPEQGMISPATFMPLAEETRLIVPIGAWVLREACAQARVWAEAGLGPLRVSVNLSAVQLQQRDFARARRHPGAHRRVAQAHRA